MLPRYTAATYISVLLLWLGVVPRVCDHMYVYIQGTCTRKETFVWWEDPIVGRVEWKYICMENGGQLLIILLLERVHMLFAYNLDMTLDVSIYKT